jgi:hypothetical protein
MKHASVALLAGILLVSRPGATLAQTAPAPATASGPPAVVTNHRPLMTGGSIQGSIWQLRGEPVTLKGPISITQDFLVPGTPVVSTANNPTFGGVVDGTGNPQPSGYAVTLGGGVSLGRLITRTDPFGLGVVASPPSPKGTRSVLLTSAAQSAGDFATLRHLALSGTAGAVAVPPGTYGTLLAGGTTAFVFGVAGATQPSVYNLQNLALTDQAQLRLVGPVILTVANGVAGAKAAVFGEESSPNWLSLRLSRIGLVLADASALHGVVRAPSGTVSMFGSSRLVGAVFCNQLVVAGRAVIQVSIVNQAPSVNAGAAQAITLPVTSVSLAGTASDDGLPAGTSTYAWTQVSGPAAAAFTTPTSSATTATFTAPGVYDLRLTVSDGQLSSTSDVTVNVNPAVPNTPPVVVAGPAQTITLPDSAVLGGSVTDDGQPAGAAVTPAWSVVSGPGTVTFGDAGSPATTASFSAPGVYLLQLDASDTALTGSGTVTITVNPAPPANQVPVVDAGPNQTITLPGNANLSGTVTDDGLPAGGALTTNWSVVSGPGVVTFGTPLLPATTADFSESGTYTLRLTASDGALSAEGDVVVTVQAPGSLLAGSPDTPIRDAIGNVFIRYPASDAEISTDAFGQRVVRTKLKIVFRSAATVGDVNSLLGSIGATISGSIAGTRALVVRIPDPGSLANLESLMAQLEANPAVWFVRRGLIVRSDALPDNISPSTNSSDLVFVSHHLAVKAHAAWNAKSAIGNTPSVLVVDYFGAGEPDPLYLDYLSGHPTDFSRTAPDDHGYHVLGIIAGSYGGLSTGPGRVTGMFPSTVALRVGDLEGTPGTGSATDWLETEMFVLARSAEMLAQSPGHVVINTSSGLGCTLADPDCRDQQEMRHAAVDWIEMVRAAGLEGRVLHTTSAGNVESGGRRADYNSSFTSAALLSSLVDDSMQPVASLSNTLVIENTVSNDGYTEAYRVKCLSDSSFVGGHLSAIGTDVFSFYADGSANLMSGTSMAAPQVAGLAAYLWSIDPALTPQQAIGLMTATSTAVPAMVEPGCSDWLSPAPSIDAYAAVLGLDKAAALAPGGDRTLAKVRLALLDVANSAGSPGSDGVFDGHDIEVFLTSLPTVAQGTLDYSRYDLNGDGYTGGSTTARFDLDINDPPAWTMARASIHGPVWFDETQVTDLDVLCYYAHSSLYPTDAQNVATRDTLLTGCRQLTIQLTPAQVSLSRGGTVQFSAVVTNADNPSFTWSLTDGAITSAGLYTAPGTPGTYQLKATSVADPLKTATATIVVTPDGVQIVPAETTVATGGTVQFSLLGPPGSAVSWSANLGSIGSSGLYTAPSMPGIDEVTAVRDGVIGTAKVTVIPLQVSVTSRTSTLSGEINGSPIYRDSKASQPGNFGSYIDNVALPPPGGAFCGGRVANAAQDTDLKTTGGNLTQIVGFLNVASVSGASSSVSCISTQTTGDVFQVDFTTTVGLDFHLVGSATVTNPNNLSLTLLGANWFDLRLTDTFGSVVLDMSPFVGAPSTVSIDQVVTLPPGSYRLRAEARTGATGGTLSHPSITIDMNFDASLTIR